MDKIKEDVCDAADCAPEEKFCKLFWIDVVNVWGPKECTLKIFR